jgi:hypothetical protein
VYSSMFGPLQDSAYLSIFAIVDTETHYCIRMPKSKGGRTKCLMVEIGTSANQSNTVPRTEMAKDSYSLEHVLTRKYLMKVHISVP